MSSNRNQETLTPYLNFNGDTAEAMRFYKSVLGGELQMQTFAEVNMPSSPEEKNRIVHSNLKSENISLMASDSRQDQTVKMGDNVHLSLMGQDSGRLREVFDKLSQGGKVDLPLQKQFWGDTFGMVTDRFGVHWMINITSMQPQSM